MLLGGWRVSWWSVGVGVVGVVAGRGLRLGDRRFRACHSWLVVAVLVMVLARAPLAELWAMSKARRCRCCPGGWWCSDGGGGTSPLLVEVPMGVAGPRVGSPGCR